MRPLPAFAVLLLLAACQQTELAKVAQPPVVSIETPVTGSAFDEGIPVPMRGRVVDEDYADQLDTLAAVWQVNGGRVCEDAVVDASGTSDCEYTFSAGAATITLTVTDPEGQSGTATSDVTVEDTTAPVATIVSPTADGVYSSDEPIVFQGTVSDGEDAAEDLVVTWTSSIDGELAVDGAPSSGGDVAGSALLSAGEHYVTMTVTDTSGRTGEDGVAIVVSAPNHAPTCGIVSPSTGTFFAAGDTILLEGTANDQDVAANELTATWSSDQDGDLGTSTPASDGSFFFATSSLSTNTHAITLTVTDDRGATCTDAILLTVSNVPEITLELPTSGDVYNEGDAITFSATVSDAEDRATALDLSWESDVDGVFSTQGANSSGVATFVDDELSVGAHTITVTVTDTDGFSALDRTTITVNGLPSAPTVSITPDPASSSDTLTANVTSAAVDPEGDPLTYRYEWYRDGVLTTDTTSVVTPSDHARGESWEVRVYASDGYGEGPYGADSAVIGNGTPSATSVSISPSTAYTDDTLTAVVTGWSDPDGDTEGYTYAWAIDGTTISGAEDSTLSGSFFSKGQSVVVTATPWDGTNAGTPVVSGARLIQNSTPTTPVVAIVPDLPEGDDDLECTVTTDSTDADGDAITYTYTWRRNGSATAYTTATVPASATSNNDIWECTAVPSDGTTTGGSASDSVTVDDRTAPAAPVLTSLTPFRDDTSATVTGTGEAACTVTLYIVNSSGTSTQSTIADGSGAFSYALTGLTRGESYSFYATCTDPEGNVSPVSNTVGTEICDPADEYEDTTGYGDVCTDAVVDWSVLSDAGTSTITFKGNILDSSDEDWYLVQTSDTVTGNTNYYRFHVEMTHGSSDYGFAVYQGGCTSSYLECAGSSSSDPEGDGYTEFEDYAEDQGEGSHTIPSDTRACGTGSSYNLCDDLGDDYYIHVFRKASSAYSCEYYELQITNGTW